MDIAAPPLISLSSIVVMQAVSPIIETQLVSSCPSGRHTRSAPRTPSTKQSTGSCSTIGNITYKGITVKVCSWICFPDDSYSTKLFYKIILQNYSDTSFVNAIREIIFTAQLQDSCVLTASILEAEVGEAPDIAEADGVGDAGEGEVVLAAPAAALVLLLLLRAHVVVARVRHTAQC